MKAVASIEGMAACVQVRTDEGEFHMDNVLIIVVNEPMTPSGASCDWTGSALSPVGLGGSLPFRGAPKSRVAVWRAVQRSSTRVANWHAVGVATAFATSLAAWAGVALVISHFVR
jgi:hypothetical protein